jgi:hypothetical protein
MSPDAGAMLVGEIAPRLRSAIPRCVQPLSGEDADELVQDAIAVAAKMLHNLESAGKQVTPGNIAYYTILHMKSGRRSVTASRSDVMACGTQLDGKSAVLSVEEEVGYDPELDEAIHLGDLLTYRRDDPAMAAAREIDWELFLSSHDYRYGPIVKSIAEGRPLKDVPESGERCSRVYQLRQRLADELREFMGEEAIADSLDEPTWRGNIVARSERAACQADRRRW